MAESAHPLTLVAGTRLGPYEILSALGVGGMGEVYRARDGALHRDVALKVLPEAFASDPDRLARFRREAQVLASLNHPNIAAIYGFEESTNVHALVLELVEGPTLGDRIAQGAIPLDEALPIAKQIAEALEAAHEQAIIHRDLKPANIKLRPDGTVKVLDFGLAKALEKGKGEGGGGKGEPPPAVSQSPTITSPALMTGVGMILGTAAYMSPEQAKGREADKRSDIWAFGCVLYEMLTGRRAFGGDDVADTLASVLKAEPDWSVLQAELSPSLLGLIRSCLRKDRRERPGDLAAASFVFRELRDVPIDSSPRTRRGAVMAAAVAVGLIGVALAAWSIRPSRLTPTVTRFSITDPDGQLQTLGRNQMAVSPDGQRLVYYSNGRPMLRELSEFDARAIPGGFGQTAFSPDGRSLAVYAAADGTIKRLAIGGGAASTVCPADNVFGMTWDSSGIVSGQGTKGLLRCPVDGGAPQQIARVEEGEEADRPQILPGGDAVLFTIAKTADGPTRWDTARIVVQSLRSAERTLVVDGGSSGRYVPSGHVVYARGGVVYAIPFDVARGQVTGAAVPVIEGVRRVAGGGTGGAQFVTSEAGHLFYIPGPASTAIADRTIALADRAGTVTRLPIPPGPYLDTRASRDGEQLAIGSDTANAAAIWIYRLGGTTALQRLTLEGRNRFPIWSPDGARVAFQSDREGDRAIFAQRVDGTGRAERLTRPGAGELHVPESWSPDGRHVLVSVVKGEEFSLWVLTLTDRSLTPFGLTTRETTDAVFSPDGRWIAYRSGTGGGTVGSPTTGVFVQPFPATGAIYPAPRVGVDFHPVWAPDGSALIYVRSAASGQLVTVPVKAQAGLSFGAPATSPARVTADRINGQRRAYDILPDGRFVGLVDPSALDEARASTPEIRVVLNWFEELKRLVPVN